MRIKTSELIGHTLDWAVAKCEVAEPVGSFLDGVVPHPDYNNFHPSTDWSHGGPIIEREKLEVRANDYGWQAYCFGFPTNRAHKGRRVWAVGPTSLIAACRCFVSSRLGDEVEIPEELL